MALHFFGRKEKPSSSYGRCFFLRHMFFTSAIWKNDGNTPGGHSEVERCHPREHGDRPKRAGGNNEAALGGTLSSLQHALKYRLHVTGCFFSDKEAGSQKDYMKGEADKYLEQTKKRIELLNEVP